LAVPRRQTANEQEEKPLISLVSPGEVFEDNLVRQLIHLPVGRRYP
jgi:hypothetical protein